MNRKHLIENLIKSWAQEHTQEYLIADNTPGEEGLKKTQEHLTWVVREGYAMLDFHSLVERIDLFISNKNKIQDGMYCKKCQSFIQYAEPNQSDGLMICYSCRVSPY